MTRTGCLAAVCVAAGLLAATPAPAETVNDADAVDFGEIFVHPRDRHYLPGTAPSRAEFVGQSTDTLGERGTVDRWEYQKGNRVISREVWTDPHSGEARGLLGIGRRF